MSTVTATVITESGIYEMTDIAYHADPVPAGSLSSSGARKLLAPSCPALFDYQRRNPPAPKAVFDLGHAAHQLALGAGPEIVVVDAPDWRTKAAQAQRDEAHERGAVPLLADTHAEVVAMAEALRRHPIASALLSPAGGTPEASMFWVDEPSGIWRRARLDWLPNAAKGRLIIPDYKTSLSAEPARFVKSAADYGYHQQAAWYLDAAKALDLAEDPVFVFIVQEKTAPYLVSVIQLDAMAVRIGRLLNRHAINTYAECSRTGVWPSYADDVALVSLPYWYERNYEDQL